MRELPADVRVATERHLAAVDAVAPGLIVALYVTGSVVLGDYQPGRSDIDFVAFTSRPADAAVLRDVHAGLTGPTCYDGMYLRWDVVPHVPCDEPPVPHIVGGKFAEDEPCSALTPSTWTEFGMNAFAVRGPEAAELGISVPRDLLNAWNLGNLNGYWTNFAERADHVLSERDPAGSAIAEGVVWGTLGAARLHYTLATGHVTSKSGAGRYALEHFPEYDQLIRAALAWRATGDGKFTNAMGLRSAALIRTIVADANKRWGQPAADAGT